MPANKTAGRPRSADYEQTKAMIRRLKCSIDPKTGKIFTFERIGEQLCMTKAGVAHYLPSEKDNCPSCHRPLEKHTE